jgi:hypothetical protein
MSQQQQIIKMSFAYIVIKQRKVQFYEISEIYKFGCLDSDKTTMKFTVMSFDGIEIKE